MELSILNCTECIKSDLNEDKKRFVHQEQSNEDYFEGLNDYLNGTMSV